MVRSKIFLFLLLGLFMISFTSAFLDVKTFDKNVHINGEIQIKDWLFFNKVDYRLTFWQDSVIDVWAEGEYTMYKKTHLFTGISYENVMGENGGQLRDIEFFIEETREVEHFDVTWGEECNDIDGKNGTVINVCDGVVLSNISIIENETFWIPYEKSSDIEEGEGKWRFQAKRRNNQKIDFILEAHGKKFDEWAWFNNSWENKREVIVNSTVSSTLTNFPVYFSLNTTQLIDEGKMLSDCSDIRVLNGVETLELPYEIENASCNTNDTIIWTQIPSLISGNLSIFVYYNNPDASDNQNATGVWNSYEYVYHFGGNFVDSAGNLNLTENGVITYLDIGGLGFGLNATNTGNFGSATTINPNDFDAGFSIMDFGTTPNSVVGIIESMVWASSTDTGTSWNNGNYRMGFFNNIIVLGAYDGALRPRSGYAGSHNVSFDTWAIDNGTTITVPSTAATGSTTSFEVPRQFSGQGDLWTIITEVRVSLIERTNDWLVSELRQTQFIGVEELGSAVTVNLLSPINDIVLVDNNVQFNFTIVVNQINITNWTLSIFFQNGTLLLQEVNTTIDTNETTTVLHNETLSDNFYIWNVESCGLAAESFCDLSINETFSIDATAPFVNITAPPDGFIVTQFNQSIDLNWTITDANLDSCFYGANFFNLTLEDNIYWSNGTLIGWILVTDKDNQNITFNGDFTSGTNPFLNIVKQSLSLTGDTQDILIDVEPNFTFSINEELNVTDNGWHYFTLFTTDIGVFENGLLDQFILTNPTSFALPQIDVNCSANTTVINYPIENPDNLTIPFFSNDTLENIGFDNVTIFKSQVAPTINVTSPIGVLGYNLIGGNETLNVTFTSSGLDTCWYNYNGTNVTIDGCVSGISNVTIFTLEENNFNMTVYANDTLGNENSTFIEWDYALLEISIDYSLSIIEGEANLITIKVIIDGGSSITNAILSYDGVNSSTSTFFDGVNYTIISNNAAPIVSSDTNVSFNFFISVDSVEYETQSNNQTITNLDFSICGGVSNDTLLNMSLFDEETLAELIGDIEFNANIISKSSGEVITLANGTFNNVHSGAICFSPISSYNLYFLDTQIRYFLDGYTTEFYNIQKADLGTYPNNLSLFPLNQNDSTEFTITYKNNNFIFTEGAVIQLQRKYIGEDVYRVVEAPTTGDGGQTALHIDLNTNSYRVSVVKEGELLDFFANVVFDCENELSGECTHNLIGTVNPNNDIPIETITDFSYSIVVDEDNQTITVLFVVPSGTPSTINVLLEQKDMFGNSTSCNTTIITSAGSITCGFTDTIEKSIIELSISKNNVQLAVKSFANNPVLDMDGINFFIVFLFMISLVGMALASPEWMIIVSVMVLVISGTLLLLTGMNLVVGLGAIAWVIVAAAIIIIKMSRQEDK